MPGGKGGKHGKKLREQNVSKKAQVICDLLDLLRSGPPLPRVQLHSSEQWQHFRLRPLQLRLKPGLLQDGLGDLPEKRLELREGENEFNKIVSIITYFLSNSFAVQEHVGAMIKSMAFLAHSSALYHGSVTRTGRTADHAMNYLLAFVAHQAAAGAFGERPRSHILHDVSLGRRLACLYNSYF